MGKGLKMEEIREEFKLGKMRGERDEGRQEKRGETWEEREERGIKEGRRGEPE